MSQGEERKNWTDKGQKWNWKGEEKKEEKQRRVGRRQESRKNSKRR